MKPGWRNAPAARDGEPKAPVFAGTCSRPRCNCRVVVNWSEKYDRDLENAESSGKLVADDKPY